MSDQQVIWPDQAFSKPSFKQLVDAQEAKSRANMMIATTAKANTHVASAIPRASVSGSW
jgi:hypothetical protein